MGIGERLREARHRKKLTLEKLAVVTGLSASFISRVEKNKTMPSLQSLLSICQALDVDVGYLLEGLKETSQAAVVRSHERPTFRMSEPGLNYQYLTSSEHTGSRILPVLVRIEPGKTTKVQLPHAVTVFYLILKGRIEITIGKETHTLSEGDSASFNSKNDHQIKNVDGQISELLRITCSAV